MRKLGSHTIAWHRGEGRSGAVGLMLILVLVLVVGTFALSVGRHALHERQRERHHQAIATLQSAIDAVSIADVSDGVEVRLPITTSDDRWVVVTKIGETESQIRYLATLFHNGQPGLSISRPAGSQP